MEKKFRFINGTASVQVISYAIVKTDILCYPLEVYYLF